VKDHVTVEALPRELPHDIKVNLSSLATLQDGVFVSDLVVSSKVTIIDDKDLPVVAIVELQSEDAEFGEAGDAAGNANAAAIEAEKNTKK
jgi:large subunit ribosomal protein L25